MNEHEFNAWLDKVTPQTDATRIFGGKDDKLVTKQRELLVEAYRAGITCQSFAVSTLRAQVDGYALVFKNIQIHQNPPGFLTRLFRHIF